MPIAIKYQVLGWKRKIWENWTKDTYGKYHRERDTGEGGSKKIRVTGGIGQLLP